MPAGMSNAALPQRAAPGVLPVGETHPLEQH